MVILNSSIKYPTKEVQQDYCPQLRTLLPVFWVCYNYGSAKKTFICFLEEESTIKNLAFSTLKAIKCSDKRWRSSHFGSMSVFSSSQFPCCYGHPQRSRALLPCCVPSACPFPCLVFCVSPIFPDQHHFSPLWYRLAERKDIEDTNELF